MKPLHDIRFAFIGSIWQPFLPFKSHAVIAVLSCVLVTGLFFTACTYEPGETPEPTIIAEATNPSETIIPSEPVITPPTTAPIIETAIPTTVPTETETVPTEPELTQPPTEFSIESSPAYQKLLTLPNAEDFLCNEFGDNVLAIYAEWIDAQEGLMETYPERWYMRKLAEGGAGFFCHSPLEEDNSCDYLVMYMHIGNLYSEPVTGRRYFTDIPREEITELIYGAYDPIGVDDEIKELFIEYAMLSEYFAWNVLDPEFRYECYYEIVTICPYPEWEPENTYDEIQLTFHVWRPGMAEDEFIKFWLSYDEELNRAGFGTDYNGDLLSGIISN